MARVLLIEPSRQLAKQYWSALEQAGHEVIICLTGQMGIMAADEHRPDVVVLELKLKHHNGIEFLYEFRSYSDWQGIPVVVQSMVPPEQLASVASRQLLGISQHLYKPASRLEDLVSAVNQAVASVEAAAVTEVDNDTESISVAMARPATAQS